MFELNEVNQIGANIKVFGIGGCGTNAINTMIAGQIKGVELSLQIPIPRPWGTTWLQ
jgi:cell division GTPase FtsZ